MGAAGYVAAKELAQRAGADRDAATGERARRRRLDLGGGEAPVRARARHGRSSRHSCSPRTRRPVRRAIDAHRKGLDADPRDYLHEHELPLEDEVLSAAAEYLGTAPEQSGIDRLDDHGPRSSVRRPAPRRGAGDRYDGARFLRHARGTALSRRTKRSRRSADPSLRRSGDRVGGRDRGGDRQRAPRDHALRRPHVGALQHRRQAADSTDRRRRGRGERRSR